MPPELRDRLVAELGYLVDDFAENADGSAGYAPAQHVTFKTTDAAAFKQCFEASREMIELVGGFRGYLEGEVIAHDVLISAGGPFDDRVPAPFFARTSQEAQAGFRESEIHVSIPVDGLDPRLGRQLRLMGFFVATMRKPTGLAEIYTIQGTRAAIADIIGEVETYLRTAGGFAHAKLKEEMVSRHWLSHDDIELPPQIHALVRAGDARGAAALSLAA